MKELFVDNFAGGGGASTGIEAAIGRSVDIAINHDPDAIAMHKANHPASKHYCEDVWQVDPVEACGGNRVALAWFSPDCTHFSRAKGGKPVDKNIRGLAWVTVKWALLVRPRVIMLENVPEIQTWGPLGSDGKPDKTRVGETFDGFICALTTGMPPTHPAFEEMCSALGIDSDSPEAVRISAGLGYDLEYRVLRSCDYGAPTTRTRFYLIARSDGRPIVWAEPTHAPKDSADVKAGRKLPYHTAAECIDWSIPAQSIFERDKPLAENTMRRIARGIQKFVIENPEPFIVPIGYGERDGQTPRVNSIDRPLGTVVTSGKHYLVTPTLIQYHSETNTDEVRGQELSEPLMTVDTSPRYALSVAHIMKNYAGGYTGAGSPADAPLGTVTAKDHNSLVTAHIMTMRNHMDGQPADEPLTTVSCSGAHHAEVQAFLVKYFSTGAAKSVNEPLDTVTTKDRFALVTVHGEEYIIADIKMRMLQPRELFNAQGFPHDYIIDHDADGHPYPKSKQVARCGNAVTPPVPAALVRVNLPEYCKQKEISQ
jgi:DNA (cytosine-5)-methyltransferase 1